jgi:hypothetical protein
MTTEIKHFDRPFEITLAPNAVIGNNIAVVALDKDADFWWDAVKCSFTGLPFGVIFTDPSRYQLSPDYLDSSAFVASTVGVGSVYTLDPPIWCPAGSSITMQLKELSGNTNGPIQFLFTGRKQFQLA